VQDKYRFCPEFDAPLGSTCLSPGDSLVRRCTLRFGCNGSGLDFCGVYFDLYMW